MSGNVRRRLEDLVVIGGLVALAGAAAADQKPEVTLKEVPQRVTRMAYSPADNNLLVTVSEDKAVRLWDLQTQKTIATLNSKDDDLDSVSALAFSPDGANLAVGWERGKEERKKTKTVLIWSVKDPQAKPWKLPDCSNPSFSPDGKAVVCARKKGDKIGGQIVTWALDGKDGPREKASPIEPPPKKGLTCWRAVFAPDGNRLLVHYVALSDQPGRVAEYNFASVIDPDTGATELFDLTGGGVSPVFPLGFFSPDEPYCFRPFGGFGDLRVWKLARNGDVQGGLYTPVIAQCTTIRAVALLPRKKDEPVELITVHLDPFSRFHAQCWQVEQQSDGQWKATEQPLDGKAAYDPGFKDPKDPNREPQFALSADGARVAVTAKGDSVEVYRSPPPKE